MATELLTAVDRLVETVFLTGINNDSRGIKHLILKIKGNFQLKFSLINNLTRCQEGKPLGLKVNFKVEGDKPAQHTTLQPKVN